MNFSNTTTTHLITQLDSVSQPTTVTSQEDIGTTQRQMVNITITLYFQFKRLISGRKYTQKKVKTDQNEVNKTLRPHFTDVSILTIRKNA